MRTNSQKGYLKHTFDDQKPWKTLRNTLFDQIER